MIAYGLRAEYEGTVDTDDGPIAVFQGGLIRVDDARDLNIAEALEAGGGVIVAEDHDYALVTALDEYPALKRVPAPETQEPTVGRFDGLTALELRAEAVNRDLSTAGSKAELVARLEAHDAGEDDPTTTEPAGEAGQEA